MKKVLTTFVIAFTFINIIRIILADEVMTTDAFMTLTENYFELNDFYDPIHDSMDKLTMAQDIQGMFSTEIIYNSDNQIEGFFNYVMQVLGGVGELMQWGLSWLWNITLGWLTKFLAYILSLVGFGKY